MNGFALNDNEYENEVNIAYTKDGGDSVTPKFNNRIKGYYKKTGFPINSIPLEDKTILFYPSYLQDWNFTLVFYLDQDIETINSTFIDSTILFYVDKYKEDELIGLHIDGKYKTKPIFILK